METQAQTLTKEDLERDEMIQKLKDSFTRNCEEF